jgi:hypothetical protein
MSNAIAETPGKGQRKFANGARVKGGWDRLLNWVAHTLGFGFSKRAAFNFSQIPAMAAPSSCVTRRD